MDKWKKINQSRKYIPILLALSIFWGCQEAPPNNPPEISELIIHPSQPKAGQIVLISGIAEDIDNDDLRYRWMASGGTFLDSLGANPIQWQSPSESDSVIVYLQVTDQETSVTKALSFFLESGVGIVAGHVKDMSTEYPLSGVVVNINGVELTTESDGYFSFTDVSAGNNIPISATAANYLTHASFMDVQVGENILEIQMTMLTELGRVAGYVTDASSGLKLAGVLVQTGDISDTTQSEGYYELLNVPNNDNVPVRASLDGYSIHSSLINVTAGYNSNDIVLEPNVATVSGRVTSKVDESPLESVVVSINQYEGITNAAGFYEIVDIPITSNASASASLEGYITTYSIVEIVGGANNLDLELDNNPGSLTGWVRSSLDGSVLGNVAVQIGQNFFTTSVTGSYEATGLQTGSTLITCTVEGYDTFTDLLEIDAGSNALDINLDPNIGNVTGFVRDSVAAVSLVGQLIQLGNVTTLSETDGSFVFEDVTLGQHLLTVNAENYQDFSFIQEVIAGTNVKNIMMIPTTGNVLGIVRNSSTGAVVQGAEVSIDDMSVVTDGNGYFEFLAVNRGSVQISCASEYFIDTEEAIIVDYGDNIHDISLLPSVGVLVGLIVDATDNAPLEGVLVTADGRIDTTDVNGLYAFGNQAVGSIQVNVAAEGFVAQSQLIEVQIGENTANFTLVADNGSLIGYVTAATDMTSLELVQVILGSDTTYTDVNGYYEFDGASVGESLALKAILPDYYNYSGWIVLGAGENTADIAMDSNIGSLQGYITDSVTAAGLDSAQVIMGSDTVRTDVTGYYKIEGAGIEENLVLRVSKANYEGYSDWIVLDVGENILDIALVADPATLMGHIRDSLTEALLDSVQIIFNTDTLMTTANGYYEFDPVVAGTEDSLRVSRTGYVNDIQLLVLNPGNNTVNVDLIAID